MTTPMSAAGSPADDAQQIPTAETRVMTAPDAASHGVARAEPASTPAKQRDRSSRPSSSVAAAVIAGVLLLPGLIAGLTPEPAAPEPLPTLPAELGQLGEHLQQLDEAVTP